MVSTVRSHGYFDPTREHVGDHVVLFKSTYAALLSNVGLRRGFGCRDLNLSSRSPAYPDRGQHHRSSADQSLGDAASQRGAEPERADAPASVTWAGAAGDVVRPRVRRASVTAALAR